MSTGDTFKKTNKKNTGRCAKSIQKYCFISFSSLVRVSHLVFMTDLHDSCIIDTRRARTECNADHNRANGLWMTIAKSGPWSERYSLFVMESICRRLIFKRHTEGSICQRDKRTGNHFLSPVRLLTCHGQSCLTEKRGRWGKKTASNSVKSNYRRRRSHKRAPKMITVQFMLSLTCVCGIAC